jgi:hypothetical protein
VRLELEVQREPQHFLVFATSDRQKAVRGQLGNRLRKVGVHVELRRLVGVLLALLHLDHPVSQIGLAQATSKLGVFREALGANVARPSESRRHVGHVLLRIDESFCEGLRRSAVGLCPERVRERAQTAFKRDHGARAAFRLERQIQVFELGLGGGRAQLRPELRGQLALLLDLGEHTGAACFELGQVLVALSDRANLHLVEIARVLLAIAGDERHRRPGRHELHDRGNARGRELELRG